MKILSPQSALLRDITPNLKASFSSVQIVDLQNFNADDAGPFLVVSDNMETQNLVRSVVEQKLPNLIQKNPSFFMEDLEISAKILEQPQVYFTQSASCLLLNPTAKTEFPFSSAKDKQLMKEHCLQFIKDQNSKNVEESLEAIIEELYMNAILDAPREALKKGSAQNAYDQGRVAKIVLAKNATRLAISCADPFGSLNINNLLKRISEVLEQGAGKAMNFADEGGAGIGCSMILEHASSVFLGVVSDRTTVVSCLIPLGMGYRQRAKIQKSLHLVRV